MKDIVNFSLRINNLAVDRNQCRVNLFLGYVRSDLAINTCSKKHCY